ncbi:nudix hydrolase 17, mitochondrial isoform X2 [Humulus lupulus]|uniref:nudix hydrolase 17, mitochondrial isoform X2 n=1 Tax=Humulus lupulus TaxID=3486 RepID=UPI002B4123A2|nr:nudix hydrolase 17, mitochondrial isoform X2 [Humulus lupulus]
MTCVVSRTGRELQRYNNMGCRQVVGYKNENNGDSSSIDNTSNELEVLVISSQKGQGFMFPKGGWELDESVEEAASRESLEEAGVLGKVERELGKWSFISKSRGTYYEGSMFPLLVNEQLDLWPEKNVRRRIWMTVTEAREVCQHWWMKEALDILVKRLSSPVVQVVEQHDEILMSSSAKEEDIVVACALS